MTTDPSSLPPRRTRVLVIGGGPGGSMAAILLAREGMEVTLLERDQFPRYHIGESLLTSAIPVLKFVGLYERMEAHGFVRKHGGYFTLKEGAPPGHIDFRKVSVHQHSYQVIRSEFDHLLLQYAAEMGAQVFERTAVTGVDFEGDRPVRARWQQQGGSSGELEFEYVIDASGLSGLLSTKVLHNRKFQPAFANVAVGSYWKGYDEYVAPDGTPQEGRFFMEALRDGSGWIWAIPLHDGTMSVGVVMHTDEFQRLRTALPTEGAEGGADVEAIYRHGIDKAPHLRNMLAKAEMTKPVQTWRDYSYIADTFSGPGYRLVGDAAAFIDPLFSTGVHLAFLGAVSAAASIAGRLRGELDEDAAIGFHDRCIRKAYVNFAIIVSGMYKQIRRQDEVVLYGIAQTDFRAAFDVILPLISGSADLEGDAVDPNTIDRAVSFAIEMVNERAQLGTENPAARLLVKKGSVHEDLTAEPDQAVGGWYIRMERGRLGLAQVVEQEKIDKEKQQLTNELLEVAQSS
ncbi:tryptophan 7-halogenase [Paraliomyxa miuraensis]|nr:tryptophan 7-halogenase [Paraliomyxa miuraensis]